MLRPLNEVRTPGLPSRAEAMNNEGERSLCLDKRLLSSARIIFDTDGGSGNFGRLFLGRTCLTTEFLILENKRASSSGAELAELLIANGPFVALLFLATLTSHHANAYRSSRLSKAASKANDVNDSPTRSVTSALNMN